MTYEYQCDDCELQFEAEQSITSEPLEHCPTCNGPVHRLISKPQVVFRGGGWASSGYTGTRNTKSGKSNDGI